MMNADEDKFWLLISGNPVDGFRYYGPFGSHEAATMTGTDFLEGNGDWWVAELQDTSSLRSDPSFDDLSDDDKRWAAEGWLEGAQH
jgi:hypothetical protein